MFLVTVIYMNNFAYIIKYKLLNMACKAVSNLNPFHLSSLLTMPLLHLQTLVMSQICLLLIFLLSLSEKLLGILQDSPKKYLHPPTLSFVKASQVPQSVTNFSTHPLFLYFYYNTYHITIGNM